MPTRNNNIPKKIVLTRDILKEKMNNIYDEVPLLESKSNRLHQQYYDLRNNVARSELKTPKWRTYVYLRKCILDYKNGEPDEELSAVLEFLKDKKNERWLASRLLDKPEKEEDEKWASGQHEWLERSLIKAVLKRSAGMVDNVESEAGNEIIDGGIDWLYIQARFRSPTKYILFKNEDDVLRSGHIGAIKSKIAAGNTGSQTKGSPAFHEKLVDAFFESTKIPSFLRRVQRIIKDDMVSGKKPLNADTKKNFVVDGSKTNDEDAVNEFRKEKILPEGHRETREQIDNLFNLATNGGDVPSDISASSVSTETTEIEEAVTEVDDETEIESDSETSE